MTRYLSLAELWYLAEHVTGVNSATLIKASRVELAGSALHAPQAGFGDTDFYPDLHVKAAVLACRIAWNHPLPDGNKRAAWPGAWCEGDGDVLAALAHDRQRPVPALRRQVVDVRVQCF